MKWLYQQALMLYPQAYRQQFGQSMLETYSDAERAAKLEGEVWAFYRHTFLDTIKDILKTTLEIARPDWLARVAALSSMLYLLGSYLVYVLPQLRLQNSFWLILGAFQVSFYVAAFVVSSRRPFSEWLYFAISAVGISVQYAIGAYLVTFNWTFRQLPQVYYDMSGVQFALGWGIFLATLALTYLRSREQKRLSRLVWYCVLYVVIGLGLVLMPVPQLPVPVFHPRDILIWVSGLLFVLVHLTFALKFWQRSHATARVTA